LRAAVRGRAGLIGGHAPAVGSPANAMTSVVADPMWDKSVKGRTDQFLYRFRKL